MIKTRLSILSAIIVFVAVGCSAATPEPTEIIEGPLGTSTECAWLMPEEVEAAIDTPVQRVNASDPGLGQEQGTLGGCLFYLDDDTLNLAVRWYELSEDALSNYDLDSSSMALIGDMSVIDGPWDAGQWVEGFGTVFRTGDVLVVFNSLRNHAVRDEFITMSEIIAGRLQ